MLRTQSGSFNNHNPEYRCVICTGVTCYTFCTGVTTELHCSQPIRIEKFFHVYYYPSKSARVVFLPRSFALLIPHPCPTPLFLNKSRPTGTWWSQELEESMLAVSMAFIFQATGMELLCSNRVLILNVPLAFSQCSICLAGSKRRQSCCCGRLYFRHFRSNLVSWRIKPIDSHYRLLTMFG